MFDRQGAVVEKKLDIKNTAIKFLLDQSVGAWANTAFFVMGITIIKGGGLSGALTALSEVRLDRPTEPS
jgi:hypothetical protein